MCLIKSRFISDGLCMTSLTTIFDDKKLERARVYTLRTILNQ